MQVYGTYKHSHKLKNVTPKHIFHVIKNDKKIKRLCMSLKWDLHISGHEKCSSDYLSPITKDPFKALVKFKNHSILLLAKRPLQN